MNRVFYVDGGLLATRCLHEQVYTALIAHRR